MHRHAAALMTATWLVLFAPPLGARSKKPSCKKITAAVWSGKTLDQVVKEFDTTPEYVLRCTQKRGRRKAESKKKKGTDDGVASSMPATSGQRKTTGTSSPASGPPKKLRSATGRQLP